MGKNTAFEHFFRFVKQIRPKTSVVVTLHSSTLLNEARARFGSSNESLQNIHFLKDIRLKGVRCREAFLALFEK
jgi:hypothetical protein